MKKKKDEFETWCKEFETLKKKIAKSDKKLKK